MAKGSGGTRATNSSTAHGSGISAGVSAAVSKFNGIKLDSAEAFGLKQQALTSALNKLPSGTQIDLSKPYGVDKTYTAEFVKNDSGKFVQKHVADKGELNNAYEQWSIEQVASKHVDYNLSVKKYKS